MIEPLGNKDARRLLQANHYGRLGCCINDEPYVVPINYLYHNENIYFHSLLGRKITTMRNNPQICLQVDEVKDDYNWQSVIVFGYYEEITEPQERIELLAALFAQLPHLTPVESKMTKGQDEVIVFCIRIKNISGIIEHW
jgi:uncharacterized protein